MMKPKQTSLRLSKNSSMIRDSISDHVSRFVRKSHAQSPYEHPGRGARALIEADLVDCIATCAAQLFYSTPPVRLWFLEK
jgi:hypothetical protein